MQGVARHPHCVHCGVVKNVSSDRTRGVCYFTGILGTMRELADAQRRLIAKELVSSTGFSDTYAMTGMDQVELFIRTVRKYSNIPVRDIINHLS